MPAGEAIDSIIKVRWTWMRCRPSDGLAQFTKDTKEPFTDPPAVVTERWYVVLGHGNQHNHNNRVSVADNVVRQSPGGGGCCTAF